MTTTTADIKLVKWTRDVYEPSDDSFLLVDALQARLSQPQPQPSTAAATQAARASDEGDANANTPWPRIALEIGCGSGYVITSLALLLKSRRRRENEDQKNALPPTTPLLLATDVSAPALASTAETLAAHGLRAGTDVELVQGDLVEPLRARLRGAVDLLIFNPPYVPTPNDEVVAPVLPGSRPVEKADGDNHNPPSTASVGGSLGVVAAAWAGGDRGRRVVDRLLPQLHELLSDEGEAFVVAVQENDPEGMIRAVVEASAAAAAAAEDGDGEPDASAPHWRTRRRGPLRGEVALRRAADEEALCILRFYREQAAVAGGGG